MDIESRYFVSVIVGLLVVIMSHVTPYPWYVDSAIVIVIVILANL
jgi:hypothetical protein